MNATILESEQTQHNLTAAEWDDLREYFQDSVMAEAQLANLAANVGMKWPIRGKVEKLSRYLNYSLDQLADMTEFYGKGSRLSLLKSILLETRRLEEPFDEITGHLDREALNESHTPPMLQQLGVPEDFPVELMNFSDKTRATCRDGKYETIGQLVAFLKESKSAVNLNEEFYQLCNSLDRMDAVTLGQFLPIREGARGVFLAEALGLIGRRMEAAHAATLLYAYRISTKNPEWKEDRVLPKAEAQSVLARVKESALKYCYYLPDQAADLKHAIQSNLSSSVRFFVSFNDPDMEGLARAIAMAVFDEKPRFKGLMGRFLN